MAAELETADQNERSARRATGMFRALAHRNFRLFWGGAFLSNVGTWMQAVAQGWLVLKLTNSPFWLGVDGFMATAPGLVLTLAGGVFADLVNRKRLLIITQIGAGSSALILGTLIYTGQLRDASDVWMILALSFLTGSCMSIAGPSYQAIAIDLVGREDLANAIALNSTQFQLSRMIGPTLAGVALKVFGLAGCFFINGLSYIIIVIALGLVRLEKTVRVGKRRPFMQDLMEGFRYVWGRQRVFMLLLISAMTSLFGAPYFSLVPYFARDILQMDEGGLALMMAVAGAGAFCGAVVLTVMGDFRLKGWSVLTGTFFFALCLMGFSFSTHVQASLMFLFGMGFSIVFSVAVINMLLQKLVTDEMRGRVMSMFILSFIGAMPIGNLLAGASAARFGAPYTLGAGGAIIAVFALLVTLRNKGLRGLS